MELEELVAGCKKGDDKYRKELYTRFYRTIFSVCYRYLGEVEDTKDLTNDVFIKIFNKITGYEFTGSFEGWIKRIAVTTSIDLIRSRKNEKLFIEIDQCYNLHAEIVDNVDKMDYDKIMKGVPEMEKTILNLFCIEGYSHKEIAEQLEISEGHSRWLLHQGRSIIKKMLEPKGVLVNVKG